MLIINKIYLIKYIWSIAFYYMRCVLCLLSGLKSEYSLFTRDSCTRNLKWIKKKCVHRSFVFVTRRFTRNCPESLDFVFEIQIGLLRQANIIIEIHTSVYIVRFYISWRTISRKSVHEFIINSCATWGRCTGLFHAETIIHVRYLDFSQD